MRKIDGVWWSWTNKDDDRLKKYKPMFISWSNRTASADMEAEFYQLEEVIELLDRICSTCQWSRIKDKYWRKINAAIDLVDRLNQ